MNEMEKYEYLADLFFKETGLMAPGKDCPAAFGGQHDERERAEKWKEWIERFYSELFVLHKSVSECASNN